MMVFHVTSHALPFVSLERDQGHRRRRGEVLTSVAHRDYCGVKMTQIGFLEFWEFMWRERGQSLALSQMDR